MAIKVREIIEKEPEVIRVERDFSISLAELWDWVTKPELTDQWFGPWKWIGEDAIEIILNREEGTPTYPARLLEVNEQIGYTLLVGENTTNWHLLVATEELADGNARFTLIHPWEGEEHRREIQAGWEYYADCLKAAITGTPYPDFSAYLES